MPEYASSQIQDWIKGHIRAIPDYPSPGITFRDITPLLRDGVALSKLIDHLVAPYADTGIDIVAGVEARGFILGGAVADRLKCGFVPVRKHGKLPAATFREDYALEYGTDAVEMHQDGVRSGERILLVDDLVATGGTAKAAIALMRRAGAEIAGAAFVIDLPALGGARSVRVLDCPVRVLCAF